MPPADEAPRCSKAGCPRPAKRHYAVGWWRSCEHHIHYARQRRAREHAAGRPTWRGRCRCGKPTRHNPYCSRACGTLYARQRATRIKAEVLAALGGRCTCTAAACWHEDECGVVMPDVLTVEHTYGNGGAIRDARRTGERWRHGSGRRPTGGYSAWARYRRALRLPDHGMRLLCFNCHMRLTFARRRAHFAP